VVKEPPRAATAAQVIEPTEETRPSLGATGSSRPPKPQPSRFSWKLWAGIAVLILIAIAIADRRGFGPDKTEVTPEKPASQPEPAPAPKPTAAAPTPAPAEPAAEPSQPKAAEPAAAPAAAEPAAAPAAPEKPAAAAEAPGAAAAASGDAQNGPLFPNEPGKPDYVVDFVSTPNGSTVTIDEKVTIVTPATINLGAMPDRIKVTAKKAGFRTSSIWMKRVDFELKGGVLKRRAMITLKADPTAPAAQ
jgi:nucleoid-associated protein YgaU